MMITPTTSRAGDVDYVEDFALSKDRESALKQLIPGTEDYYYYHCLHYLNSSQFEKIEPLTRAWYERHRQTARLTEIQTRQALLTYEKNPEQTLRYIRDHLGLNFDHQKETVGLVPNLPISLDPNLISRETLRKYSLSSWSNLDNFEDVALDQLANEGREWYRPQGKEGLEWHLRRNLLQRLTRSDIPKLANLVFEDLSVKDTGEFGYLPIHRQLTLAQLDELLKLKPDVRNQSAFVQTYLTKLQPGADDDWKRDRKLTLAYLERLQTFVATLDPVHNALKAHVAFHRLALDRSNGIYDKKRFMAYIQLPRFQPYMCRALNDRTESHRHPATLTTDYSAFTLLPTVGSDESLVRSYVQQFFSEDGAATKEFEAYIDDVWLRNVFAETQIELGRGEPEAWASKLAPERFRALKDRIDIDFEFTNRVDYNINDPVALDLHIKNVPQLIIKVFEINTTNFYRLRQSEVDTDVNLDGLVPNWERVVKYDDSPFRRMPRRFEFPELKKAGVYVVDFIGGGKSSRALIRKGSLRPLVSTGSAGQTIRVVDENNELVTDAKIWLRGTEHTADKNGAITLPFTSEPGMRSIVISRGDFSCLSTFDHKPEAYRLAAGIHIDRETMLTQRIAPIVVRPGLFLNGSPVSLKLLEDVRLMVTTVDHLGIPASNEVPDFKLFEDRESVHEIRVPARLKAINVTLTANVKAATTGLDVPLAANQTFALNEIERTDKIEDLHLARFAGEGYVLEVLGRTGETKPDRPVQLSLKHREFKTAVTATLKTDPGGRVHLGELKDIVTLTATGPEGTAHTWNLLTDAHTYRSVIHAKAGEPITLPYVGDAGKADRAELGLLEVIGENIRADRFDAITVANGQIVIKGLAAADYVLHLKQIGQKIRLRVVDGKVHAGHVLGSTRHLEMVALKPVAVESVTADKDSVTVKVRDASEFTRVHVFATRYQPAFSAFASLGRVRDAELAGVMPGNAESVYLTGRNIGDEYRYVLDRKGMRKFPGNMLDRPALLLNPWAIRTTETGEQLAMGGDDFAKGGRFQQSKDLLASKPAQDSQIMGGWNGQLAGGQDFANLDFLGETATVLMNMLPDKDGVIKLTRKEVGPHAMIHVVAVDPLGTTVRSVSLPEVPASFRDLRLKNGLNPEQHFTQQKQVTVLEAGKAFTIADISGSRFQSYDSLSKVFAFYTTLSKNPTLTQFGFILGWPKLKVEEKRKLYSENACHELSFFISRKDPQFFEEAVKPYLRNKKDKTFLDHYLLGNDVSGYLKPWEYSRLNTVERVLLAQRVPGERTKATRHLDDMLRLLPPNIDKELFNFDVGVDGTLLAADGNVLAIKLMEQKSTLARLENLKAFDPSGLPQPTGAMGGSGPGGFGVTPSAAAPMPGMPAINSPEPAAKKPSSDHREGGMKRDESKKEQAGGEADKQMGVDFSASNLERNFFDEGENKRREIRQLYRKLDPTKEWAENNYYNTRIHQQIASLVPVADFWHDYAKHEAKAPFLTRHVADAHRNFTEMMFALSVLDLPFEAGKHDVQFADGQMTLTPAGPVIAFHEEVRPAAGAGGQLPILISENFYRHGDRYREENGEKYDKFITEEFLTHVVYGSQIVVTNPTSSRQKLTVLLQLPLGAIPVLSGQFTRSLPLDLEPYRTQTVDYFFYFPAAGKFPHFPAHVAKNEQHVGAAQTMTFNVVAKATREDTESWDWMSQNGTNEGVLAFLNRENVRALSLEKIAFRMKDREFYEAAIKLLNDRHQFNPTLWSYSIHHADVPTIRQYLPHQDAFVNTCGGPIDSPLMTIDLVDRHQYEHLEYKPLVNARAHSLGNRRQIVNDAFLAQYHAFLKTLTYQNQLDDKSLLGTVYYLLLQDRIEEAMAAFARVNPDRIPTRMQYDYCAAYLEMFKDEPVKARAIATAYKFHPVDRWRNTFAAIIAQLDEIEGKGAKVVDGDDRDQKQGGLAATEVTFDVKVGPQGVNLSWQNCDTLRVNYYLMDVELLFSTSPFVQRAGEQFSTIKPNGTELVKLPAGRDKHTIPMPAEFDGRNVLVEVVAAGKTRSVSHLANTMTVTMSENYGQLKVADNAAARPLSKVYVKVYAKLADGSVKFHKDGYTDLRGRFDYTSVNTPERQAIERFAVLVLSDDRGAAIRDVAPPQR